MGGQSIGSEVAAVILTTLIGTHNRCLVEAPGKGLAHDVRGIRWTVTKNEANTEHTRGLWREKRRWRTRWREERQRQSLGRVER